MSFEGGDWFLTAAKLAAAGLGAFQAAQGEKTGKEKDKEVLTAKEITERRQAIKEIFGHITTGLRNHSENLQGVLKIVEMAEKEMDGLLSSDDLPEPLRNARILRFHGFLKLLSGVLNADKTAVEVLKLRRGKIEDEVNRWAVSWEVQAEVERLLQDAEIEATKRLIDGKLDRTTAVDIVLRTIGKWRGKDAEEFLIQGEIHQIRTKLLDKGVRTGPELIRKYFDNTLKYKEELWRGLLKEAPKKS